MRRPAASDQSASLRSEADHRRAGWPHPVHRDRRHFAGSRRYDEGRTLADTGPRHFNVATVKPHEIVNDRQAQPEPAVPTRGRGVRLAESVEDVGRKAGSIPIPVSVIEMRMPRSTCSALAEIRPPFGVNSEVKRHADRTSNVDLRNVQADACSGRGQHSIKTALSVSGRSRRRNRVDVERQSPCGRHLPRRGRLSIRSDDRAHRRLSIQSGVRRLFATSRPATKTEVKRTVYPTLFVNAWDLLAVADSWRLIASSTTRLSSAIATTRARRLRFGSNRW